MNRLRIGITLVLAGIHGLLSGCAGTSPPSEFYLLTPMSPAGEFVEAADPGDPLSLGVGPLKLPEYLDRPHIVTRSTPNRLALDEFHRWGGSLRDNMLRVLAQNLAQLLHTDDVAIYPWDDPVAPDYRVRISVLRFDGSLGGQVELDCRWIVVGPQRGELLSTRRSLLREPVRGADHASLVEAQSRALAALSRDIADQIRSIQGRRAKR